MRLTKGTPCVERWTKLDPCKPETLCDDPEAVSFLFVGALAGDVEISETFEDDITYTLPARCDGFVPEEVTKGTRVKQYDVTVGYCAIPLNTLAALTGLPAYTDAIGDVVGLGTPGQDGERSKERWMRESWIMVQSCDASGCPDGSAQEFIYRLDPLVKDLRIQTSNQSPGSVNEFRISFTVVANPQLTGLTLPAWPAGSGAWPSVDYPNGTDAVITLTTTDIPSLPAGTQFAEVPTPGPNLCTVSVQPALGPLATNQFTQFIVDGVDYGPSPFGTDPAGIEAWLAAIPNTQNWTVTAVPGSITVVGEAVCGLIAPTGSVSGGSPSAPRTVTLTPIVCP